MPGAIVAVAGRVQVLAAVAVAVALLLKYSILWPARLIGALVGLYNSTKSCFSVAPELPPPP